MIAVHVSGRLVAWFELRRFFFLCGMPASIGMVVAFLFPMAQQASRHSPSFAKIWFPFGTRIDVYRLDVRSEDDLDRTLVRSRVWTGDRADVADLRHRYEVAFQN